MPKPPAIRKVTIENIRNIDRLEIEFLTNMTLLAGPNGCGKTTVLDAIASTLQPSLGLLRKDALRSGSERGFCRIDFDSGEAAELSLARDQVSRTGSTFDALYFSAWREPMKVGPVSVSLGKRGRRPDETDKNRLWRVKQRLVDVVASLSFTTGVEREKAEDDKRCLFQGLDTAWRLFYPDREESWEAVKVSDGFDVVIRREGHPRSVDSLSAGEIEIFSILGTLATTANGRKVVLIDEPELHLHVEWHRALIVALQEVAPETQFICATHSRDMLEAVRSYERFFLFADDDPRAQRAAG